MSSCIPENQSDAPTNTLGALLYADDAAPIDESEWVALVHDIAGQDQAALRELYERTNRIVFTLAFRIVKSAPTAEEVMLDVYHDVWQKAERFDPVRGTVIAWLMNQTRSRAIDRTRAEHRKKRVVPGEAVSADAATSADNTGSAHGGADLRAALGRSLQALTLDERRAIETAYFDDLTYAEAAERLGEPVGTIKTRIRTGLAKLRTLLAGSKGDL